MPRHRSRSRAVTTAAAAALAVALAAAAATSAVAGGAVVPGRNGGSFTSSLGANRDIAELDPCGIVRTLIGGPAADLKPVWSPDGRRLAFMSNRDGNFDIYLANADGTHVRPLTDDPANDFNPTWSPDRRRLA